MEWPKHILFISPHPDDIAISCGGMAILAGQHQVKCETLLVTDGSEARIPLEFLENHGWKANCSAEETRVIRGKVRENEAIEESRLLGMPFGALRLLQRQSWHNPHHTKLDYMYPDMSIRDVSKYVPGPILPHSWMELVEKIQETGSDDIWLLTPHPDDVLAMHRITTGLTLRAALEFERHSRNAIKVKFYETLSARSMPLQVDRTEFIVGFDHSVMKQKQQAILAHHSMIARRAAYGGYVNKQQDYYDVTVYQRNIETARERPNSNSSFAERFHHYNLNGNTPDLIKKMFLQEIPL